jgi:hypothetical protein
MSTFVFPEVSIQKDDDFFGSHHINVDNHQHDQIVRHCVDNKQFYDKEHDKILMTNTRQTEACLPCYGNGLLGTMFMAYSNHQPLSLRPDDIWIAILVNFGRYVQNHAEDVRHLFVNHQGKKELVVKVKSPFLQYTTPEHWEKFIELMADTIQDNVKSDLVPWMTPTFTTTTHNDVMVANLAIMSTVREYFDMKFELSCGLSQVTLEGTLEDWQKLYTKTMELHRFKINVIDEWCDLMLPILQEFINSYQGQVNTDFWQKICTSKRRGSGSQQRLRGWFLVFGAFSDKGKYLLNPLEEVQKTGVYAAMDDDDVPDCGISVNVTVDDHGAEYHALFYAGLLLTQYDQKRTHYHLQLIG